MTPFLRDAASVPTILIVDDTEMHRRILTAVVEGLGMRARAVDNGEAALEFCKRECVDAILMDIEMPGIDGLETTRIRALGEPAGRTPIIAVTSKSCADLARQTRRAGMNLCLEKPVRPAEIAHALRAVLLAPESPEALSA